MAKRKSSWSCRCGVCKQIARIRKLNDTLNRQIQEAGFGDRGNVFWSLPSNDTEKVLGLGGYVCLWVLVRGTHGSIRNVAGLCMCSFSAFERQVKDRVLLPQAIEIIAPPPVVPS